MGFATLNPSYDLAELPLQRKNAARDWAAFASVVQRSLTAILRWN